jgi:uncharacterized membrane protein YagU involved in acid resistance
MSTVLSTQTSASSFTASAAKTILTAGFVAGTLDIIAAMVLRSIQVGKVNIIPVLKFIASGMFGKEAFKGGITMAFYGLAFHFIIAFGFAIGYFLAFPHLPFLRKHKIISGLLYGVLVWLIMNLVIVPLSNTPTLPFKFGAGTLIHIAILMCFIGLPVSLITHKYYTAKSELSNL